MTQMAGTAGAGAQRFTARVRIAGINPYVAVPGRVLGSLGAATKVPVLVKVSRPGARARTTQARLAARLHAIGRLGPAGWYRTTIVPSGRDRRLYLDQWMRAAARVGVGDTVEITLRPDRAARELRLPAPLAHALEKNPRARTAWDRLAPSRRREILSYLSFLATPAALERNVRKVLAQLT